MIPGVEKICEVRWNEPLAPYTTFKVGGPVEALALPASIEELAELVKHLVDHHIPWLVLGRGSNVLVSDLGVQGVVILLGGNFVSIGIRDEDDVGVLVNVQSGCSLSRLLKWTMERGLTGLEFSVGIPASIGGGIVMNCGAWGEEIGNLVTAVTAIGSDGTLVHLAGEDLNFGYMSWGGDDTLIVAEGSLRLGRGEVAAIREKCRRLQEMRRKRQPLDKDSGGCFFRNPTEGKSAGQLIEEAGLKGLSVGDAQISEVHANFVVNNGKADAADIMDLIGIVRREVEKKSSVVLEPEVKLIGW